MDMVAHAAAKAGKEPTIVHQPAHPADVQQTLADPRKSQNLLGFTPLHPFTGG
jgi:nucleoside-diphosphate-sugar epimerase